MPAVRGRIILAVSISLVVHGLFVLGWLNVREKQITALPGEPTAVDGPDDREMVINLREPRPQLAPLPQAEHRSDPPPPAMLPSTIDTVPPPGAVALVGSSHETVDSLPKTPPGIPLHGKLKAGKSIVYVLDRSSSMGADGLLRRACASIKASLGQLNTDCRFQIVAYNGGVDRFDSRLTLATVENRERAERWLDTLIAEGASDHRAGVREALSFHPDTVFLLTDADDLDEKEVRAIRVMLRERVHLTAAVFGGKRMNRDTPLERLTREMGGEVRYVGR